MPPHAAPPNDSSHRIATPTIDIPQDGFAPTLSAKTPKTPADEGMGFFEANFVPGEAPIQVYELKLDPDGGPGKDTSYIRLPPPYLPYVLRISIDVGTPASRNGVFKTNFPIDGGVFDRNRFAERKLPKDVSKPIRIDLPISHAGAFAYWVEYDNDSSEGRVKGREGYFNIDPILRLPKRTPIFSDGVPAGAKGGTILKEITDLPIDGLNILTVVSKWMGKLDEWRPYFQEAMERGYNMLHYTPLQRRGQSQSPYSIADFLSYDPGLFNDAPRISQEKGRKHVAEMLKIAKEEYGILSLTDVVLNHTANNSEWLLDHPEAGYSPYNTPNLTPALEIDDAMLEFSKSLSAKGLPVCVSSDDDVSVLIDAFRQELKALNLWQYYVLDVKQQRTAFRAALGNAAIWQGPDVTGRSIDELADLIRSSGELDESRKFHKRYAVTVNPVFAASLVKAASEVRDEEALADSWIRIVDVLNVPLYKEWEEDTQIALSNIKSRVHYHRVADHGPKMGEITEEQPLVEPYFTRLQTDKLDVRVRSLANNGWIWTSDPTINFVLPPSKAYLRREVIVWGDSVKLRYGNSPDENPWLWQRMMQYVEELAATFDGFRLDNCHSTPLHVGMTLLDAARAVNPNLYVCAELFTGSAETDLHFVSRLGINSLIREAYNGFDIKEPKGLSRILHRYGLGKPIGSMDVACLSSLDEIPSPTGKGPNRRCVITPLQGSVPHALLFDLTHDNESPMHYRSAEDALSTGALVTFSYAAIASVKGFDDLYPKYLNIASEKRKYQVEADNGIGKVKRILNHLHTEMVLSGFTEGHVHQENDYIIMHRVQPVTQKGYILVAHTAFSKGSKDRGHINPIKLRRTKVKFVYGSVINITSYEVDDPMLLRGLPSALVDVEPIQPHEGSDHEGPYSEIVVPDYFPPGSIMLFETQLKGIDIGLDELCGSSADDVFSNLNLVDLNAVLYRAEGEELDATAGAIGAYDVPGMGKLVYCGLEGWMHPLRYIMKTNDLGHPLCANLRDGTWAFHYSYNRLYKNAEQLPNLVGPANWMKDRFDRIEASAPPFLRPKYFAIVIFTAYKASRKAAVERCSEFVASGHDLTQDLALCSVQMYGLVKSASLDPGKPVPSLAAGLPHFAAGWARTWGRDVFISLRGLFLTTSNFNGAKNHILAFASTLKHGLIPNLLDSVRNPRYNSRDSPWWMLQNIQDYVKFAPDGISLLSESVKRRFPKDDSFVAWDDPRAYAYSSTIAEIIQEILQHHAHGIRFREYNAGPNLDMQMRDEGFNIEIEVDWSTGFIHGGNRYNCGTWMDKMGESVKAGTKGIPGTPRDGAPIEITGLVASTLRWLDELSRSGKFPFQGVEADVKGTRQFITYGEWVRLIRSNFETHYYIPKDSMEDSSYHVNPSIISRRGIYKDVFGSGEGREWSDYQLRCNFPIAMVVAPELFDPQHALEALKTADQILRGPLGMKTLDPNDGQYRPIYDNSNDSDDPAVAKGRNYHNGPEWGWPLGYFMRAYLHFDNLAGEGKRNKDQTIHRLHTFLLPTRRHIQNDPWRGVPELTNENGGYCHDSCNTQAWSASTLLDFLDDVHSLK